MGEDGRIVYTSELSEKGFADGAKKIQSHMRQLTSDVENSGRKMEEAFDNVGRRMQQALAVGSLYEFQKKIIEVRGDMEKLQISFETLAGKQIGRRLYEDIKQFATTTPMMMSDLAKGAQTLLGFNIAAEKVMPILRQIGDISMGDSQKFNSLALAFAQMSSTGKLMGQDLLQMINAGFNPLVQIAEKTGKSVGQLKEEMSQGAISVEMVEEAFRDATAEGGKFYGMLEKQSQGMAGAISNLKGAYENMLNDIGQQQQGVLVDGINLATEALKHYEEFAKVLLSVVSAYGAYKAVLLLTAAAQKAAVAYENIRLMMMYRKELGLATAAQQAFNLSVKASPLGLLVGAITGVVAALTLFTSKTDEAAEAQDNLSRSFGNTEAEIATERREIDTLFNKLRKAAQGTREYKETKDKILNQYGAYLKGLGNEIETLKDVEGAYRRVAQAARDAALARGREAALKDANENYRSTYAEYTSKIYDMVKAQAGEKNANLALKAIRADLKLTGQVAEDTQRAINRVSGGTVKYSWFGELNQAEQSLVDTQKRVDAMFGEQEVSADKTTTSVKNLGKAYSEAKTTFEEANKTLERMKKNRNEYTEAQWTKAVDDLKKAKEAYEAVGGDPDGKQSAKGASVVKDNASRRQRLFEQDMAAEESQSRQKRELRDALHELEIASEEDNAKRELMQMQKDHEDKLAAIREQADQWKKEAYKAAEERWNATNKDKTKTFADTDEGKAGWQAQSLTPEQEQTIQARVDAENAIYNRGIRERLEAEKQHLLDYLKEYGSISQKKQAIAEEYDKKIAEAQDKWQKKSLEQEKKKAQNAIDIEVLKTEIDWTMMFDGIGDALRDEMVETLDKIEKYIQTDSFKQLDAKEKAEYIKMRNELVQKTGSTIGAFDFSIYGKIAEEAKAYQNAMLEHKKALQMQAVAEQGIIEAKKELQEAEEELKKNVTEENRLRVEAAKKGVTFAEAQAQSAADKAKTTQGNVVTKQGELASSTTKARKALDNFGSAMTEMTNGTLRGFADGLANLVNAIAGNGKTGGLSSLGSALGSSTNAKAQIVAAIISIIDAIGDKGIGDFVAELFDRIFAAIEAIIYDISTDDITRKITRAVIQGFSHLFEEIGKNFENVWQTMVQYILGAGPTSAIFDGIFGWEEEEKLEDRLERIGNAADSSSYAIEHFTEELDKATGVMAMTFGDELRETILKQMKVIISGIDEVLWDDYGGHHSDYYHLNKDQELWNELMPYLRNHGINAYEASQGHNTWQEMLRNDPENLAAMFKDIQTTNPELWNKIANQAGYNGGKLEEWLEKLIEAYDKLGEAADRTNEKLTSISYDSLESDFLNSLYDMADGSEDVFDDIEKRYQKMLNRMIVDNLVFGEDFQTKLKKWYEDLAQLQRDRNENKITDEAYQRRLEELKAQYQQWVAEGKDSVEFFREMGLIQAIDEAAEHFGDLRSKFLDTLMDMEFDAEEWKKELNKKLVQDLLEKQYFDVKMTVNGQDFDNFDAYAKDWNKRYLEALEAGDEAALQALIDELVQQRELLAEASEDLTSRLKETVEDTTFKDMSDSWVSTLMDMNATAEDWAQNIGQIMVQKIVEQLIAPSLLQPLLDGLQGAFNTAMSADGATWDSVVGDAGVQEWLTKIRETFPEAQNIVRQIMESLGLITAEGLGNIKDNFVSALTDINKTAEDLGKDIANTMYSQMVDKFVDSKYSEELKRLSDEWAEALKSGDTAKIEELRQKIIALYQAIGNDEDIKKLLDDLNKLNTEAGSTPFDNLRNSYLSAVMDMKKSTKDFTDDIMNMIAEAFIDSFVLGTAFDEKLNQWKEEYRKITSDNSLSETERLRQLKSLGELIAGERDTMRTEANNIMTMLGLNQGGTDSATMNMADKATYDQFELYLGIANSQLMVSEQHKQIAQQILSRLESMNGITSPDSVSYGERIYTRLGTTNEYLLATKNYVRDILAEMANIKQSLNRL